MSPAFGNREIAKRRSETERRENRRRPEMQAHPDFRPAEAVTGPGSSSWSWP